MPRMIAVYGLLLAHGLAPTCEAQESSGKPDTPIPKPSQRVSGLPRRETVAEWEKRAQEPQTVTDLSALAASLAAYVSVEGCQQKSCGVLVRNFTLPDGDTSTYGIQLADQLSRELARKEYKIQLIDREHLQNLLTKDRIPARSVNHTVIRWIADELEARFMVFGTTERLDDGQIRLSTQLIDTTFRDWSGHRVMVTLSSPESDRNFEPVEPFPSLPGITSGSSGERVYKAGVEGTGHPQCTYMPNPAYSEGARKLRLNGPVTGEAVVTAQGRLENIRIVRGLPGGLNEQTITALQTWRCQPALKDGAPVANVVEFTVQFRLD